MTEFISYNTNLFLHHNTLKYLLVYKKSPIGTHTEINQYKHEIHLCIKL